MAKNDKKAQQPDAELADGQDVAQVETTEEVESTDGLVKMHKDGEHLHVHPTTVDAHKAAGWKIA